MDSVLGKWWAIKFQDRTLGQEDALEEVMATHISILARRIPMDRGAWWAIVPGVAKKLVATE